LTNGLEWLRSTYLSNATKIRGLPTKKLHDISRDAQGYIQQIHFVFEQANMIRNSRTPNKTDFMAYRELLFKWRDIYRLEAERKVLQFNVPHPSSTNDPQRTPVYGDQTLLEQLVYNLVNNAVKYCYRGTKIHMDCKKRGEGHRYPHILTVTNYGIELKGDGKVFDLYYRGSNVKGQEGLGIGLHIARQIATDHGGDITHTCKPVSEFNVPLLEAYLRLPHNNSNLALRLREELYKLKSINQYFNIVALDENGKLRYVNPSTQEILDSIEQPTWEVTFTVTIPSKEA
jgi:signal transduction histidine kinase